MNKAFINFFLKEYKVELLSILIQPQLETNYGKNKNTSTIKRTIFLNNLGPLLNMKEENLTNFYNERIEEVQQRYTGRMKENLEVGGDVVGYQSTDIGKAITGITGELLCSVTLNHYISTGLFSDWDTTNGKTYYDIKALAVRDSLDLSKKKNVGYYSFYLQEKQLDTNLTYILILTNKAKGQALIIQNDEKLNGQYIKDNLKVESKNPSGVKTQKIIPNYIIKYSNLM